MLTRERIGKTESPEKALGWRTRAFDLNRVASLAAKQQELSHGILATSLVFLQFERQ